MTDQGRSPLDHLELHLEAGRRGRELHRLRSALTGALRLTWRASPRGFVVAAALQVTGALAAAALVVVGQLALSALLQPGGMTPTGGVVVIVALAAVTAVGSTVAVLQQQQQRLLGERVSDAAWRRVLDVAGRVELEHYESPRFYDQLERIRANAIVRPTTVTTSTFGLLGGAVATVSLLAVLFAVDPLLVPALLAAGVPSVLLTRRAARLEFGFAATVAPVVRAREYLRTLLTGRAEAKEVRAFGSEAALRRRHDDRSERVLGALHRHVRTRQLCALAVVATSTLALSFSLGLLVWFLSVGRISVADAGAAALGIRMLSQRLDGLFQSVGGLLESSVFLEDLDRFLQLAVPSDGGSVGDGPALRHAVSVQDVSYTYPGSAGPVLHGVDLTIGAGEVVAIVGENGSGKTTLAKLIGGLYTPSSGRILWDGVDTRELEPARVRRSIAVIFQDFVRYQLTARENIGLGDPDHADDMAAVRRAAGRAGAAGFLERLPAGYDTVLSTEYAGGVDLSVGQWQRVALARALRRDTPLVILDEPSSALDPRAEQQLFTDVRAMVQGRAALLISHRYSTVRSADRILVMRDGRILEAGSHDSLMALDGLYAELFSLQAKAYR